MTTTYKKILQELMPSLQLLAQMQGRGLVMLPSKVAYAIGKNLANINPLMRDFEKERMAVMEDTVNMAGGKLKIIQGEKGEKYYDWKEGGEEKYKAMMDQWLEGEVNWISYRMPKDLVEGIDNFPVEVHPILEEFEMVTDLNLTMAKLPN